MDLDVAWRLLQVLLLLMVANGAPVVAARLLPAAWMRPVDRGYVLGDGRPLFGRSKTWPGLVAAVTATAAAAVLFGYEWIVGAATGAAAMIGDLLSSFTKRRMGIAPSGQALGIDQIPEALLPALVLAYWLPLTPFEVGLAAVLFFILELPLSVALFHLGVRKRPY